MSVGQGAQHLPRPTGSGLLSAARRIGALGLGVLAAMLWTRFVAAQLEHDVWGFDFRGTLWEPGRAILAGDSPYPPPVREAISDGNPAVYPPAVVLAALPVAALPWAVAQVVWPLLLLGAVAVGLGLLGVRDWRCYAVALSASPVMLGIAYGNVAVALVLAVALAWRVRHRPWALGIVVGAAIVAKLLLWPLLVWLAITRRTRSAVVAAAFAASLALVSWAVIGFDGMRAYPTLLRALDDVYADRGVSLVTVGRGLGLAPGAAGLLPFAVGSLVLVGGLLYARRGDVDRRALSVAVVAAIAFTPVAWPFTHALVIVPLALARPRLSFLWAALYLYWPVSGLSVGTAEQACCRPPDVPEVVWGVLHAEPPLWHAVGTVVLTGFVAAAAVIVSRAPGRTSTAVPSPR